MIHRGAVCVNGVGCGLNDSRALLDLTATALDPATGTASAAYTADPDANFFTVASGYTTFGELPKKKKKPAKHRPTRRHPPPHRDD